ncbi:acyltransferase [Bradyrhizobium sediminis]|uniref:Acyltransferase n=1 Tax=Bradyrhizobium sediminis TaxID=2840469 RepID=A0A975RTV0_9BRAD|nr:acyltransferase [Bradyrhizobium sediminis]QWG19484.1 acyltransferase [Bradyrhizobium sediminis]
MILIVLAFHSVLPYLASLPPAAYPFDSEPYLWLAFPIVDSQRWFGFDLFCAWQDVVLMTLMFFLSGLFVPSSLARKGSWKFLSDRLLRIGLPMALAIIFLAPLAYYAAYRTTATDPSPKAYWQHWLALPFWPCGPQWFLGMLLIFNALAAATHGFVRGWGQFLVRLAAFASGNPVRFLVVLVVISALAYVPLVLAFSPFAWVNIGPISFQSSRPLHYLVYFLAGVAVGTCGLDRGLLDRDGVLARRWPAWLSAAFAGFLLWAVPTSVTMADWGNASLFAKLAAGMGFVVACAAGCLCSLAICLRFAHWRLRAFDSLSANAYRMYLIHYVFAVWLQYALLGNDLFAIGKAAIVFGGTLIMSWSIAAAVGGAPPVSRLNATMRGARRA